MDRAIHTTHRQLPSTSSAVIIPERTACCAMEAPSPPDTVALADHSCLHSRSGPVIEDGVGVFQPPNTGEYSMFNELLSLDSSSASRVLTESAEAVAEPDLRIHSDLNETTSPPPGSSSNSSFNHSTTSSRNLTVYYQNVRGLRTKIDDVFIAVSASNYDVIVFTETWLSDQIFSQQIFGHAYSVYRNDRNVRNSRKSRGGGVLIAVARHINSRADSTPVADSLEQLWVKLKLTDCSMSVGVIYLPPDRKTDSNCVNCHIESIGAVQSHLQANDHAILLGDYNQSGLVWNVHAEFLPKVDVLQSHISPACASLLDGFNLQGLTQINTIRNRNNRLLDLALVNETTLVSYTLFEIADPLSTLDADHPSFVVELSLSKPEVDELMDVPSLDFHRANYVGLVEALERINWSTIDASADVNDAVQFFSRKLHDAMTEHLTEVRDLGVILDAALTFRVHYNELISRANRQLGFMFKIASEFRDPLCLRSLYCSLVRSILESNVVVWCPYQSTWISRIEAIQRKFVRYALRNLPWNDPINLPRYEDRCRLLGIETLEQRRNNAQAIFVAKILLGEMDSLEILNQINIYAPTRVLRQRGFLRLEARNTGYGSHDPIRFMSATFNGVYELFDFNTSATTFKRRLQGRSRYD